MRDVREDDETSGFYTVQSRKNVTVTKILYEEIEMRYMYKRKNLWQWRED